MPSELGQSFFFPLVRDPFWGALFGLGHVSLLFQRWRGWRLWRSLSFFSRLASPVLPQCWGYFWRLGAVGVVRAGVGRSAEVHKVSSTGSADELQRSRHLFCVLGCLLVCYIPLVNNALQTNTDVYSTHAVLNCLQSLRTIAIIEGACSDTLFWCPGRQEVHSSEKNTNWLQRRQTPCARTAAT